jgi:hypothetical protein
VPLRDEAVTLALVDLALALAVEAAEVCAWFAADFEPIAALRAAGEAFGEAYGPWYEFGEAPE